MHVRGAVRNGVSEEEISVVLITVGWVWGLASRIVSGTSLFPFPLSFWAFCGLRSLGEGIWGVWIGKFGSRSVVVVDLLMRAIRREGIRIVERFLKEVREEAKKERQEKEIVEEKAANEAQSGLGHGHGQELTSGLQGWARIKERMDVI